MTAIELLNKEYKGKNITVIKNEGGETNTGTLTDFHVGSTGTRETPFEIILYRLDNNYNASYILDFKDKIIEN